MPKNTFLVEGTIIIIVALRHFLTLLFTRSADNWSIIVQLFGTASGGMRK